MRGNYREIERLIGKSRGSLTSLKGAESAEDVRTAWEEFLWNFQKTMGRLISLSSESAASRSFGRRLKNASTKDDPGLVYLREARNSAEHGLDQSGKFYNPSLEIGASGMGGAMKIVGGSGRVDVTGMVVDDGVTSTKYEGFSVQMRDGEMPVVCGGPVHAFIKKPAGIILRAITSDKKSREVYAVPLTLGGVEISKPDSEAKRGRGTAADPFLLAEVGLS